MTNRFPSLGFSMSWIENNAEKVRWVVCCCLGAFLIKNYGSCCLHCLNCALKNLRFNDSYQELEITEAKSQLKLIDTINWRNAKWRWDQLFIDTYFICMSQVSWNFVYKLTDQPGAQEIWDEKNWTIHLNHGLPGVRLKLRRGFTNQARNCRGIRWYLPEMGTNNQSISLT